ncbi:MAG: response regulator [Chloroflexi bacterium]|nr:MAG: response regulator [Chloroflexota bacterium]
MLRIIIVDDEAVIRMGLRAMVTALGHRVVDTAANGDEALEKVKQHRPDLLLLDIKMPGTDGLTVAEILSREMPLPIVMLTAYSDRELIERAANAAVMGYLIKPVQEERLGPALEVAVDRFRQMQATARQVYKLRNQLEARDVIDAARRILVAAGLSEEEAYRRLQATAREKRCSMKDVAEAVIAVGGK